MARQGEGGGQEQRAHGYSDTIEALKYRERVKLEAEERKLRAQGYTPEYINFIMYGVPMPPDAQMMREGFERPSNLSAGERRALLEQQQEALNAVDMDAHKEHPLPQRQAPKVKGQGLAAGTSILGGILKSLAYAGGANNQHLPDPLSVVGDALQQGAAHMSANARQKAYNTYINEGLAEEADDYIDRFGLKRAPAWVRMQLVQRLMQQREEALRAYFYGNR